MTPKRFLILAFAVLLIGATAYLVTRHPAGSALPGGGSIVWTDFGTSLTSAHATNKKIVIDVYTDWCKWCKVMDAKTYSDPSVAEYMKEHFVAVKLNAESQQVRTIDTLRITDAELASAFGVEGYPTTVFANSDGTPIFTRDGYIEAAEFKLVLRFVAEDAYRSMTYADFKKNSEQ